MTDIYYAPEAKKELILAPWGHIATYGSPSTMADKKLARIQSCRTNSERFIFRERSV